MKRLLLLLFLCATVVGAQQEPGSPSARVANRLYTVDGTPSAGCASLLDVGKVHARKDAQAANSTAYICSQNGVGTFGWELISGTSALSSITAPTANTAWSMGAFTWTLTWGATTGSNKRLFELLDTASNTGTGCLFCVSTATGSALFPFEATAVGTSNGVRMSTLGVLAPLGSGAINANQLNGTTTAISSPSAGQVIGIDGSGQVANLQMSVICELVFGDPGAASPVLADDNDAPSICKNISGYTETITSVKCYAPSGSPTVTPIVTGGAADSILTGALTCSSTAGGATGTLNGTPTLANGGTIDANITTAGGVAKYLVIYIVKAAP